MRTLVSIASALLLVSTIGASAQHMTPQQERMRSCNTEASSKHMAGNARKTFMSDCLTGKVSTTGSTTMTPQQEKMKSCNTQASAKHMAGDARKTFMNSCLKG
ncbi:PsiF family protein [Microvirga sp. 2TAF3]|uniref:PsiF family protein n=1 Tax=Microvirga sp. 2TAF3 TaxID=3233014 RepID=UPI003F9B509C